MWCDVICLYIFFPSSDLTILTARPKEEGTRLTNNSNSNGQYITNSPVFWDCCEKPTCSETHPDWWHLLWKLAPTDFIRPQKTPQFSNAGEKRREISSPATWPDHCWSWDTMERDHHIDGCSNLPHRSSTVDQVGIPFGDKFDPSRSRGFDSLLLLLLLQRNAPCRASHRTTADIHTHATLTSHSYFNNTLCQNLNSSSLSLYVYIYIYIFLSPLVHQNNTKTKHPTSSSTSQRNASPRTV